LSVGKKTPKTSPWDIVTLLEEDRAMAMGNMLRKIGKDRSVVPVIPCRTIRQTCSSQYVTSALAGEVKITVFIL